MGLVFALLGCASPADSVFYLNASPHPGRPVFLCPDGSVSRIFTCDHRAQLARPRGIQP